MTRLRWGLLGAGHIARNFARNLLDAGFEVTTVGSRSRAKADSFARELGLPVAATGSRSFSRSSWRSRAELSRTRVI